MKITTHDEFIARLTELYALNVAISKTKNSDYAGASDPFANFKSCAVYGIDPKQGIFVRMTDKMMRIANLLRRPAAVADESVLDTLSDLANYAMILRMYIEHESL